jgi:hypothetical protein
MRKTRGRWGKKPEWEMQSIRQGGDRVKNQSGECEGPEQGAGTNSCLKRKVF